MAKNKLAPEKITSPIQLLAAWFVALIVLDGGFLTAAGVVTEPSWLPSALVIAAILNVPLFLGFMFFLQTRFRPEMQSDEHYSKYLEQKKKLYGLTSQMREQIDQAGLSLVDLVQGRTMSSSDIDNIRPLIEEMSESIKSLQDNNENAKSVDPDSLRVLAQGELGVGNWSIAAKILNEYAKHRPEDFEANFSRGVAYANSRDGVSTDLGALRAYNDAVASMPESLDGNYRARLFTYRGAMLKRMRRFEEAIADFKIAEKTATNEYEQSDLLYNLASTYALMGDRSRMMEIIHGLPIESRVMRNIRARLGDYFKEFSDDKEFLQAIGAANK